jgi:beta-lactamase regulating signal transducer with metallopeptidase domain
MNLQSIARSSSSILLHLIDPAARSLAIGILAALALRLFRVKNPSARLAVWAGVLYAALAMPLLALMLPPLSIYLPVAPLFAKTTSAAALTSPSAIFPAQTSSPSSDGLIAVGSPASIISSSGTKSIARHAKRVVLGPSLSIRDAASLNPASIPQTSLQTSAPSKISTAALTGPRHFALSSLPWSAIAAVIFCLVALLMIARIMLGSVFGHRLSRSACTIADCDAIRVLIRQARIGGVASPPRLAESDVISVPLTLGVLKPLILLPSYWRKWDEPTLSAVIAHEMSHIARRDALTQRLALIHRAIFWFSPLSWWLNRALAEAAEEASDEAVLLAGADRAFYAETLLGFFAALSENSGRVYWQGVSMASFGQADRRVDRILSWKGAVSMRIRKTLAVGLVIFGVPFVLLTAAAHPSTQQPATPAVPTAAAARAFPENVIASPEPAAEPSVAPAPAPVVPTADPASAFAQGVPAIPAPPDAESQGPAAPSGPAAAPIQPAPMPDSDAYGSYKEQMRVLQQQIDQEVKQQMKRLDGNKQLKQEMNVQILKSLTMQLDAIPQMIPKIGMQPFDFALQIGPVTKINIGDEGDRFVIVSDNSPIIMSGDSEDVEHATALRSKINGDFIWFQHNEKSYIIRDQATVNQAKALFKSQQDLDEKQQDLGKQMRALGDQMRTLGQKMRDVHVTVPDLSAQMEKLEAQMKQLSASGGTEQQVGDLQRQLGDLMRQIGQTQSQAGDQQRQIGEQMRALGDQQHALGDQMRQIGDQQRDASHQARTQMDQLLNDAIIKGTAQPE